MSVVEIVQNISETVDKLLDFLVQNEILSADFEKYLEINQIEVENQNDFNIVALDFLFERKMQSGIRVIDFCATNNAADIEIISALKNSYLSIFEIKKIEKNSLKVHSVISENDFELMSLIKTVNLRGLGRNDFIKARIIELQGTYYILEIFEVIGSNSFQKAYNDALKMLIEKPKLLCFKNNQKLAQMKLECEKIYADFVKFFNKYGVLEPSEIQTQYLIAKNKNADELLKLFNNFCENGKMFECEDLLEMPDKCEFFDLEEFIGDDFLNNAALGFANCEKNYDIGFVADKNAGFFTIPFLQTFKNIFEHDENDINSQKCAINFLMSDKIPPFVIEKFAKLEKINEILQKNGFETFENMNDLIANYKSDYRENTIFSPVMALYNSNLFKKYMGFEK